MMDEMIIIDGVSKEYGELKVLKDIHLHIQKGAICGIIGQSGAGKSTLLRCINGLEKFDSGKILIDGVEISIENERAVRNIRREIPNEKLGLFQKRNRPTGERTYRTGRIDR